MLDPGIPAEDMQTLKDYIDIKVLDLVNEIIEEYGSPQKFFDFMDLSFKAVQEELMYMEIEENAYKSFNYGNFRDKVKDFLSRSREIISKVYKNSETFKGLKVFKD